MEDIITFLPSTFQNSLSWITKKKNQKKKPNQKIKVSKNDQIRLAKVDWENALVIEESGSRILTGKRNAYESVVNSAKVVADQIEKIMG